MPNRNAELLNKYFAPELDSITDVSIRDLVVRSATELCGDYFWTRPAAKNNRYHPSVSCGDLGLVRHVKYACWWGEEIMRALDVYPEGQTAFGNAKTKNHDSVIAALILHDMMKEGDPDKAGQPERSGNPGRSHIMRCHGIDMADAMFRKVLGGQFTTREQQFIVYGVACHMGVWTSDPAYIPHNLSDPDVRQVAMLVAGADYNSSRKADDKMAQLMETIPPNSGIANG